MILENALNTVRRKTICESVKYMWFGYAIAQHEQQGIPIRQVAQDFLSSTGFNGEFTERGLIAAYYRTIKDFKIAKNVTNATIE